MFRLFKHELFSSIILLLGRAVDQDSLNPDPDPDPDPAFQVNPDPVTDPDTDLNPLWIVIMT
jgi:hypothetical protein